VDNQEVPSRSEEIKKKLERFRQDREELNKKYMINGGNFKNAMSPPQEPSKFEGGFIKREPAYKDFKYR